MNAPAHGALRQILEAERKRIKCSRADLTVLSNQVDPYRLDTPAGHLYGAWLGENLNRLVAPNRRIHWRGLHYAIASHSEILKPDRSIYRNTDDDWTWMFTVAGKAARWLGYIPFDRIFDARNSDPLIFRGSSEREKFSTFLSLGIYAEIPDVSDLKPRIFGRGFESVQPYALAIFGEKTSLEDVLLPIARRYQADLYLPSGEISDSLLYRIAKDGAEDGRPLIVFVLADCDPAGHQMAVSIGRKLQAFRDLHFPDLEFEVRPVGLTVDQVKELKLPSTPLKETELRADRWREAFGVEQTEIDALATLQPKVLIEIVEDAIAPFYDHTLSSRMSSARRSWEQEAQKAVEEQIDQEYLERLREEASEKLDELRQEIDDLNERLSIAMDPDEIDLPEPVIPDPVIDESTRQPSLVSSAWPWAESTRALIERKRYGGEA